MHSFRFILSILGVSLITSSAQSIYYQSLIGCMQNYYTYVNAPVTANLSLSSSEQIIPGGELTCMKACQAFANGCNGQGCYNSDSETTCIHSCLTASQGLNTQGYQNLLSSCIQQIPTNVSNDPNGGSSIKPDFGDQFYDCLNNEEGDFTNSGSSLSSANPAYEYCSGARELTSAETNQITLGTQVLQDYENMATLPLPSSDFTGAGMPTLSFQAMMGENETSQPSGSYLQIECQNICYTIWFNGQLNSNSQTNLTPEFTLTSQSAPAYYVPLVNLAFPIQVTPPSNYSNGGYNSYTGAQCVQACQNASYTAITNAIHWLGNNNYWTNHSVYLGDYFTYQVQNDG